MTGEQRKKKNDATIYCIWTAPGINEESKNEEKRLLIGQALKDHGETGRIKLMDYNADREGDNGPIIRSTCVLVIEPNTPPTQKEIDEWQAGIEKTSPPITGTPPPGYERKTRSRNSNLKHKERTLKAAPNAQQLNKNNNVNDTQQQTTTKPADDLEGTVIQVLSTKTGKDFLNFHHKGQHYKAWLNESQQTSNAGNTYTIRQAEVKRCTGADCKECGKVFF